MEVFSQDFHLQFERLNFNRYIICIRDLFFDYYFINNTGKRAEG